MGAITKAIVYQRLRAEYRRQVYPHDLQLRRTSLDPLWRSMSNREIMELIRLRVQPEVSPAIAPLISAQLTAIESQVERLQLKGALRVSDNLTDLDERLQPAKALRVGVVGGTFDPIHWGHILLALEGIAAGALDFGVIFPGGEMLPWQNYKSGRERAEVRYEMARLVGEIFYPLIRISPLGLQHPEIGNVDSVMELYRLNPGQELHLSYLVGGDAARGSVKCLARLPISKAHPLNVLVKPRQGQKLDIVLPVDWQLALLTPENEQAISSTLVRSDRSYSAQFLPASLMRYIEKMRLYCCAIKGKRSDAFRLGPVRRKLDDPSTSVDYWQGQRQLQEQIPLNVAPVHADLHTHTYLSDGDLLPAENLSLAGKNGVKAIGLTDHNHYVFAGGVSGQAEALGVVLVPGAEIFSQLFSPGGESLTLHLLAYGVREGAISGLQVYLEKYLSILRQRIIEEVRNFQAGTGLALSLEPLFSLRPGMVLNVDLRHFLVSKMLEQLAERNRITFRQALEQYFSRLWQESRKYFSEDGRFSLPVPEVGEEYATERVIGAVHEAGGKVFLAHPGFYFRNKTKGLRTSPAEQLKLAERLTLEVLAPLVGQGLDGLEVYSLHHDTALGLAFDYEEFLKGQAARFGLTISGGTDFHGDKRPRRTTIGEKGLNAEEFAAFLGRLQN